MMPRRHARLSPPREFIGYKASITTHLDPLRGFGVSLALKYTWWGVRSRDATRLASASHRSLAISCRRVLRKISLMNFQNPGCSHHTVEYDPFKSQLASMKLTLGPHVVQIWAGRVTRRGWRPPPPT